MRQINMIINTTGEINILPQNVAKIYSPVSSGSSKRLIFRFESKYRKVRSFL